MVGVIVKIAFGREKRRMRSEKGSREEDWLFRIGFLEDLAGLADDPRGRGEVVSQRPWFGLPAVGRKASAFEHLPNSSAFRRSFLEEIVVIIACDIGRAEDAFLVTVRFGGRDLMHVPADENGRIAGIRQELGHCGKLNGSAFETDYPAGGWIKAGEKGMTSGNAGRARGVGAGEERAIGGETIKGRSSHNGMSKSGQTIAAHLVGHDQKNVGALG